MEMIELNYFINDNKSQKPLWCRNKQGKINRMIDALQYLNFGTVIKYAYIFLKLSFGWRYWVVGLPVSNGQAFEVSNLAGGLDIG